MLAYEFDVAPKWFFEGAPPSAPVRQRSFVLIEDQIQLCQPVVNRRAHEGWWYVELVRVDDRGDHVAVADDFIDVMVGSPDHPYRVLDLDELADAAGDGRVTPERLIEGLGLFQRFLDRHLNRRDDAVREMAGLPTPGDRSTARGTDPGSPRLGCEYSRLKQGAVVLADRRFGAAARLDYEFHAVGLDRN